MEVLVAQGKGSRNCCEIQAQSTDQLKIKIEVNPLYWWSYALAMARTQSLAFFTFCVICFFWAFDSNHLLFNNLFGILTLAKRHFNPPHTMNELTDEQINASRAKAREYCMKWLHTMQTAIAELNKESEESDYASALINEWEAIGKDIEVSNEYIADSFQLAYHYLAAIAMSPKTPAKVVALVKPLFDEYEGKACPELCRYIQTFYC